MIFFDISLKFIREEVTVVLWDEHLISLKRGWRALLHHLQLFLQTMLILPTSHIIREFTSFVGISRQKGTQSFALARSLVARLF